MTFNFPDETVAPAPRENLYAVGDSVVLPRRKHAGVNEDAGVGQVGLGKLLHDSGKLSAILGAPVNEDSRLAELCANIIRAYQVCEYHT